MASSGRRHNLICIFGAIIAVIVAHSARSQTMPSTVVDETSGLANVSTTNVIETLSDSLLVTTQDGVFVYNGKRALQLTPENGVPDHEAYLGASRSAENIYLYSSSSLYRGEKADHSLSDVQFTAIIPPVADGPINDLVANKAGVLVIQARRIRLYDRKLNRFLEPPASFAGPLPLAGNDQILRAAGDEQHGLWLTTSRGRLCHLSRGNDTCIDAEQILPGAAVGRPTVLADGSVWVRNLFNIVHVGLDGRVLEREELPDQNRVMRRFHYFFQVVTAPNGDLVTQSAHGVAVRHNGHWRVLRIGPACIVTSMVFDSSGTLSMTVIGRGLWIVTGFGTIENFTDADGLTSDTIWNIRQGRDGSVWVGNGGGVERFTAGQPSFSDLVEFDLTGFTIVDGTALLVSQPDGLTLVDTSTGRRLQFNLPGVRVTAASSDSNEAWAAVAHRLVYFNPALEMHVDQQALTDAPILNLAVATEPGRAWALTADGLTLWQGATVLRHLPPLWPADFSPTTLAAAPHDGLWIGGAGGICRAQLTANQDRVLATRCFSAAEIGSGDVIALLVDHTGRLWAGTGHGVSVYDGQSWRVIDRSNGLIWNDIDQDSLFEDRDHGIWIGTSQGLSHIVDPDQLLHTAPLTVSISQVRIGDRPCCNGEHPYDRGTLTAELGSPGTPSAGRISFLYRLAGAEKSWSESTTGQISYPYLPYGRLRLQIRATDRLNHVYSPVAEITFTVRPPPYLTHAAFAAYTILALVCIVIVVLLADRIVDRKRAAHARLLEKLVRDRTSQLETARRELEYQARTDGLTGIANRATIEREVRQLMQAGEAVSLLLFDLDFFKRINDEFGHLVGDAVLQAIAARLATVVEPGEVCGRYGGEEFMVCLRGGVAHAEQRARALIDGVTGAPIEMEPQPILVTCSAGLATREDWDSWETLLDRADAALYQAKHNGRAQIQVAAVPVARALP